MISLRKQFSYNGNHQPVKVLLDYTEWQKVEDALQACEVSNTWGRVELDRPDLNLTG